MPFASSETLRRQLRQAIRPFNDGNVKHGAYELRLGADVVSTTDGDLRTLAVGPEGLPLGEHVDIQPGQLAMLMTEETVHVPPDRLAFISIRAGAKFDGLVNVSGFHVDPGFEGRLKFTVYNAGSQPVPLRRGQKLFMIWFADFDRPVTDLYHGDFDGQMQIGPKDVRRFQGDLASPAALAERIAAAQRETERVADDLSTRLVSLKESVAAIRGAVYTGVVLLAVNVVILSLRGCSEPPSTAPVAAPTTPGVEGRPEFMPSAAPIPQPE